MRRISWTTSCGDGVKTPSKTRSRKPHIELLNTPLSSRTQSSSSNTSTVSPTRTLANTGIGDLASGCSPACSHELKTRQWNVRFLWNTCIRITRRKRAMRVNTWGIDRIKPRSSVGTGRARGVPSGSERSSEHSQLAKSAGRELALEIGRR